MRKPLSAGRKEIDLSGNVHRRSRKEFIVKQATFYQAEIDYARTAFQSWSYRERDVEEYKKAYYDSTRNYLELLDKIVHNALVSVDSLHHKSVSSPQFEEACSTAQSSLSNVPELLHDVLISALQRRVRRIRNLPLTSFPTFTFSEAHPTYPLDIEAIERINFEIHVRIRNIFHGLRRVKCPLLRLSDKNAYSSRLFHFGLTEGRDSTQLQIEHLSRIANRKRAIRGNINLDYALYCIRMPRWAPRAIRYSAVLAHEHFHRVIQFISEAGIFRFVVCEESKTLKLKGRAPREKKLDEYCGELYGPSAVSLAKVYWELIESLFLKFPPGGDEIRASIGEIEMSFFQSKYEWNRSSHVSELLCDLGGIMMTGPAYLFAFVSQGLNGPPAPDVSLFEETHPSDTVRLHLMAKILSLCGNKKLAQACGKTAAQLWTPNKRTEEYMGWIDANEEILGRFVKLVQKATNYRPVLDRDFELVCSKILGKLWDGNHFVTGYDPLQVLNAIWYKMAAYPGRKPLDFLWRLAIRHCKRRS